MAIEFGHMEVTGALNENRLNVEVGTEFQLEQVRERPRSEDYK